MDDMELDDLLGGPSKAPSRPARFAPKGSKLKPKPKTEPSHSLPQSTSVFVESLPVPKKEEPGGKLDIKPEYAKHAIQMDVEVNPVVTKEEGEDLMETEAKEAEGEREDEVVREIDVYFTPSFDPKTRLYVLQYPLRALWRPYELDERCEEVRVKQASVEVEIDLAVDVKSKNYDSNADSRVQMKKQTLTTSWNPPPSSGYAVGVLTGNKLHLHPVHAVVQLRPSMQHLDSGESKKKTGVPSNAEKAVKLEEPQEGKPSASKKMIKIPEQTKDNGEEVWVPLKYHTAESDIAAGYLQKMKMQESSEICFTTSQYDYLNSLCPSTSSDSSSSFGPTRRHLLTLPLKERFKFWLLQAPQIHRFDALMHLAPDEKVEDVLEVLMGQARLVQGLWVPRTNLVYKEDRRKESLARDYTLLLLSKNVIIKKSQIRRQLEKEMVDVLNVLAVHRSVFEEWKLKVVPDISFIKRNPSVVKKQEEEWERMERKLNDLFSGGKNEPAMKNAAESNAITSKSSNKVAAPAPTPTRTPIGATSRSAMTEEVRESIAKALQKLFKSVKVCSYQQISQRLRDMAVSESQKGFAKEAVAAAKSIDEFPNELHTILAQVAVNIHGICVPKSSPDHPQFDSFRKVVIDLFLAGGPNAKLKKAPIMEAAKMELKREIPPNEYQKVLLELCQSQGSAWILKTDGNPKH